MNRKTLAYAALSCVIALGIWLNKPDSKPDHPLKGMFIVYDTKDYKKSYKPGDIFQDCDTCPSMIVVPSGSFMMGPTKEMALPKKERWLGSAELPQHKVTISKPFAVGRFEITVKEFDRFVRETNYNINTQCFTGENNEIEMTKGRFYKQPGFAQEDDYPAVCIPWTAARDYTKWLSNTTGQKYRLLSEAEWEYVAKAGTQTDYWWGNTPSVEHANFKARGTFLEHSVVFTQGRTMPVMSYKPNPFGLYNILGNATEWVADCWHDNYENAPADGSVWLEENGGTCVNRIVRGGHWNGNAKLLLVTSRNFAITSPDGGVNVGGFRVARDL